MVDRPKHDSYLVILQRNLINSFSGGLCKLAHIFATKCLKISKIAQFWVLI